MIIVSFSEHHYKNIGGAGPESERTMIYYNLARVDGLHKRVKTATEMDEYFVNRDDFLVHRHVEYGGRNLKAGPAETNTTAKPAEKPIEVLFFLLFSSVCMHVCRSRDN